MSKNSASRRLGGRQRHKDSIGSVVLARSASANPSSFVRHGARTGPRIAHSSARGSICLAIASLPTASPRLRAGCLGGFQSPLRGESSLPESRSAMKDGRHGHGPSGNRDASGRGPGRDRAGRGDPGAIGRSWHRPGLRRRRALRRSRGHGAGRWRLHAPRLLHRMGGLGRPWGPRGDRLAREGHLGPGLGRNDSVGSVVLAGSSFARASSFTRYGPGTGPRLAHSSSCERICCAITSLPTESFRPGRWIPAFRRGGFGGTLDGP